MVQIVSKPGHKALGDPSARIADFTLLTQYEDGLHARAGSRSVVESVRREASWPSQRSVTHVFLQAARAAAAVFAVVYSGIALTLNGARRKEYEPCPLTICGRAR